MGTVKELGDLGFEVSDLDVWASFAADVVGLQVTRRPGLTRRPTLDRTARPELRMHEAVRRIHEAADILREEHAHSDAAGQLTEKAARVLRDSGGMRLLQSADRGGYEAAPADFFEWVRAVGRYNPSAGWIAGVVGVHPWELALVHPTLQDEIYGDDPDTWVSSPYAPMGRVVPVEGGYRFTGEWPYSTGTDQCEWAILGALVADGDGAVVRPPDVRHVVVPRADYEIVEGSWNVMGLQGTGSKNVRVTDAFVPEHRVVSHAVMQDGGYRHRRPGAWLYHLPFGCMFSAAIASGVFGMARGALDAYREYLTTRVSVGGVVGRTDPFQQEALAEAEADLAAGIVHVDRMIDEMLAVVAAGGEVSLTARLEFRRNQVRAVQRVLFSIDKLFSRAGSAAAWTTRPLERFWRDLRTGGSHICNVVDTPYTSWANHEFATGGPVNTLH